MINSRSLKQDAQGTEASIEVTDACILEMSVYTNGPQGGDGGHGGKTRLVFTDLGGVCFDVEPDENEVTLVFKGDAELRCLAEGLRFLADALEPYREQCA